MPVGGTVVYSTCSLSPIQNDGVVQMALKKCWEETQSTMIVKYIILFSSFYNLLSKNMVIIYNWSSTV